MTQAANLASLGAPMIANTSGNVGVGTSTPAAKLHVVGGQSYVTGASGNGAYSRWYNNAQTTGDLQAGQGWASGSDNVGFLLNNSNAALLFGTNGTERMRIDSSGRVTQPFQPSFHVRVNNAAYISTSPVPFSNAVFNVGSNFNTSTYRFTAPVAGKYNFLLQMYLRVSTNQYVTFYLRVNDGRRIYSEFNQPSQEMYVSVTLPAIFDLGVGDFVDVEVVTNGSKYYGGNQETNFYGFLLG